MVTDIPGVRVGHWTDAEARTGCTVVILPEQTIASGEVRGGAPATREFALLDPTRLVSTVDAVVLSGGSAFGLSTADGVMGHLEAEGRGFATVGGPVPIVVGMSLFDLGVGDAAVRPGPNEGAAAVSSASDAPVACGLVGAGTGATVGKWRGSAHAVPGGLGGATIRSGDVIVSALIAVNAVGSIDDGTTTVDPGPPPPPPAADSDGDQDGLPFGNTTIGVIVTNAIADKMLCHLMAQSGHDGMARALMPAHTRADGDALVACATGAVEAHPAHLRVLAQNAVTMAIRSLS